MEPATFLSALLAIVVIDLVLAGDNAIVIALAARSLPPALQKRAIVWGAIGAIGVRSLMTVIVVWLLHIPGLLLAGGLALLWIAYRLLLPDGNEEGTHAPAPSTFWGAMRTIVIADAVMGLDNMLAVGGAAAGAAHNSVALVVLGLLISIPIVVWGSTLILGWIERFPALLYVGGGVLAWTAVKMMTGEPLVKEALAGRPLITVFLYAAIVGGVPAVSWLRNRRLELRKDLKETLQ
jgi:YjbE family integral membrane protein